VKLGFAGCREGAGKEGGGRRDPAGSVSQTKYGGTPFVIVLTQATEVHAHSSARTNAPHERARLTSRVDARPATSVTVTSTENAPGAAVGTVNVDRAAAVLLRLQPAPGPHPAPRTQV
jgi:hypothetical protein